jgi:hypothetical protein
MYSSQKYSVVTKKSPFDLKEKIAPREPFQFELFELSEFPKFPSKHENASNRIRDSKVNLFKNSGISIAVLQLKLARHMMEEGLSGVFEVSQIDQYFFCNDFEDLKASSVLNCMCQQELF